MFSSRVVCEALEVVCGRAGLLVCSTNASYFTFEGRWRGGLKEGEGAQQLLCVQVVLLSSRAYMDNTSRSVYWPVGSLFDHHQAASVTDSGGSLVRMCVSFGQAWQRPGVRRGTGRCPWTKWQV